MICWDESFCAANTMMMRDTGTLHLYPQVIQAMSECVARGEINQFTGVMCESFHDIWMELHEDLIVLQRVDRVAEGSF